MNASPQHVHLVGIGGIGLSAIARILVARGIRVSGSDQSQSTLTDELQALGVQVFIGHHPENIGDADLLLVTSAAQSDNPEVSEAKERGIRIAKRVDFLPELTAGMETIAVAGTHGKTTTTGMIAAILQNGGLDPTVVVGGIIPELHGNSRTGTGKHFVIEADEYDRAFWGLRPSVAVVTSIEMDHPDCYRDLDDVARAFHEFLVRVPSDGLVVGLGDHGRVAEELGRIKTCRVERYGLHVTNDWVASDVRAQGTGSVFKVRRRRDRARDFSLKIPGQHNVLNALAAIAVADHIGVDASIIRQTLAEFRGALRRFEIKGEFGGVTIIDDYAHHPSEIRATLAAAQSRFPGRPIWAVFQPHTYTRTLALLDDFAQSFEAADHVIVTEVFGARETDTRGVSGKHIVDRMKHRDARFIGTLEETVVFLAGTMQPGDVLITLGAGDVNRVGVQVGSELNRENAKDARQNPK